MTDLHRRSRRLAEASPTKGSERSVAVVGGGVIGSSIAWRCARRGHRVVMFEPDPAASAAHAAAGMLWAATEPGTSERMLTARRAAASRWPGFAAELTAATGLEIGFATSGTLSLATTVDQVDRLRVEHDHLAALDVEVHWLGPGALADAEPALTADVAAGLLVPGDHQVSPPALLVALRTAARRAGVDVVPEALDRAGLAALDADVVVVASGWRSGELVDGVPVRPVKGQTVWLRPGSAVPLPRHVLRSEGVYVAARPDEIVVGATVEDVGVDLTPRSGPVATLLASAIELVPALADVELVRCGVGLRPCTPDEEPAIGWLDERTVVASGHHRNGILLAPTTADLVADLVDGVGAPEPLASFSPHRFG